MMGHKGRDLSPTFLVIPQSSSIAVERTLWVRLCKETQHFIRVRIKNRKLINLLAGTSKPPNRL